MKIESIEVESGNFTLRGIVHFPKSLPAPCVICSHGLFSAKESPKFVAVAQRLAAEGFVAVRYDHRGCGESDGRIEETTVTGRLEDLEAVYDFVKRAPLMGGPVGLMGSSMGGYISLFTAALHPEVSAAVVWATPFELRAKKEAIDSAGGPALKDAFYEDLKRHHLPGMLATVRRTLVLHGEKDALVPVRHAKKIHEALATPKGLEIFPEGDHRFTDERLRQEAIALTAGWFKRYLPWGIWGRP